MSSYWLCTFFPCLLFYSHSKTTATTIITQTAAAHSWSLLMLSLAATATSAHSHHHCMNKKLNWWIGCFCILYSRSDRKLNKLSALFFFFDIVSTSDSWLLGKQRNMPTCVHHEDTRSDVYMDSLTADTVEKHPHHYIHKYMSALWNQIVKHWSRFKWMNHIFTQRKHMTLEYQ